MNAALGTLHGPYPMITFSREVAYHFFKLIQSTILPLGILVFSLASAGADEDSHNRRPHGDLKEIGHIIVIYQENWSFDSLYGQFPGANGYANSFDTLPQLDVKANPPYSSLIYQTPSPLDEELKIDSQFPAVEGKQLLALASNHNLALPLIPYDLTKYIPGRRAHRGHRAPVLP